MEVPIVTMKFAEALHDFLSSPEVTAASLEKKKLILLANPPNESE
jgi:hypothetical protein